MFPQIEKFILGVALAIGCATASIAQDVPAPTGDALLTVSGEINTTNVGDALVLDADSLSALGSTTIETSTIWTDGVQTFEGVPLKALADLVGATDGMFLASAINDYTVEIPVSDAVDGGPIIAHLLNGAPMSVRDKGPLWIIYPYDDVAEYRSEVIYSRSIWQLDRIEVVR